MTIMSHWAEQYIGMEWVPGESDCWALFRRVQHDHFGLDVPIVDINALDLFAVTRAFSGHDERRNWYEVVDPVDGDAALMVRSRYPSHVGVVVDGGVLHSLQGIGVVWQKLSALRREWASVTFYRHWEN